MHFTTFRSLALAVALHGAALLAAPSPLAAQQDASAAGAVGGRTLVVGTKEAAPFSIRQPDGSWTGLSHELWRDVAAQLGLEYQVHELALEPLLDSVAAGTLDVAVAAITVTPERELVMDFTHPFHVSGLGIAVSAEGESGWLHVFRRFFTSEFATLLLGLLALLFAVGFVVWLFERRRNPEQFGGTPAQGLGTSMWWSAVTMTTVGYGDVSPRSLGGRLVALVWMFAGIILVSSFTAAITTTLTVGALEGPVSGPDDLPRARVATVPASTSAEYLRGRGIAFVPHETPEAALAALARDEVDAVVYDAPILRHLVADGDARALRVLPGTFERQYYGLALPDDSPLREPLNRALLEIIEQPRWRGVLSRYLGE